MKEGTPLQVGYVSTAGKMVLPNSVNDGRQKGAPLLVERIMERHHLIGALLGAMIKSSFADNLFSANDMSTLAIHF